MAEVRLLVKWLVRMRAHGVTSQGELASILGYGAPELSMFMTGKSRKARPVDLFELTKQRKQLLANLSRKGFAVEFPKDEGSTADVSSPTHSLDAHTNPSSAPSTPASTEPSADA